MTRIYNFVQNHSHTYPIGVLCDTLSVSRSAFYAYKNGQTYQPTSDKEEQQNEVKAVFAAHKCRYGSRRIVKELRAKGKTIGRDFVRNVLVNNGLVAIQPRSFVPRTTNSRHTLGFSPNRLLAIHEPTGPNQVWPGRPLGLGAGKKARLASLPAVNQSGVR